MSFIYNFILALIMFSSLWEMYSGNTESKPNKTWFYTLIVLMALVAGLAYGISPDWVAYWNTFEGTWATNFSDLSTLSE